MYWYKQPPNLYLHIYDTDPSLVCTVTGAYKVINKVYCFSLTLLSDQRPYSSTDLDKVTLDLSKGRFFTGVFLALCIHKTKFRNVQFYHILLEI